MNTRFEQLITESRKLTDATKRGYITGVRNFFAWLGVDSSPSPRAVEDWVQSLKQQGLQPQSINRHLMALKWASKRSSQIDSTPDFAANIDGFKEVRQVNPNRALSADEAVRLLNTCGSDRVATRDRAILLLGLRGGLRRNEIAVRKWPDLDKATGTLTLIGKGGREEKVVLDTVTIAALASWEVASRALRKGAPWMFYRAHTQVAGDAKPLTSDGVYKVIQTRAAQAGIADVSPHSLRHTCATLLLKAGVEPWRVQKHLRHRGSMSMEGLLTEVTGGYAHDTQGAPGEALTVLDSK